METDPAAAGLHQGRLISTRRRGRRRERFEGAAALSGEGDLGLFLKIKPLVCLRSSEAPQQPVGVQSPPVVLQVSFSPLTRLWGGG